MMQLAPEVHAEENRAFVRGRIEERGWTEGVRREAWARLRERLRATWTDLYFRAYEDGANRHRLGGHRLDQYAHCYADIAELMSRPLPLECFWLGWQGGIFVAGPEGGWYVRADLDDDGTDEGYYRTGAP